MLAYNLEHICSYNAQLQNPPEVIGPVPEGIRINFYVTSGEFTGPKIRGILRPVGGDWFTIRTDGIGLLDVRATIETHDNALIFIAYTGVGDLGEDGYHKFLKVHCPPGCPCARCRVSRPRIPHTNGSIACSVSISVRPIWNALKCAMTCTLSGSLQSFLLPAREPGADGKP
jgi:hypothetical protein